jgi:hypothetical protein
VGYGRQAQASTRASKTSEKKENRHGYVIKVMNSNSKQGRRTGLLVRENQRLSGVKVKVL